MKKFFVKDLSGRGYTCTPTADELRAGWENEPDSDDTLLYDYIDQAETGDEWETHNLKITRVE